MRCRSLYQTVKSLQKIEVRICRLDHGQFLNPGNIKNDPENEAIDKVYSDIVYFANSNFCTIQRNEAATYITCKNKSTDSEEVLHVWKI